MHPPRPKGHPGFTLIELLVVIAIIGLISAVALPVVLPALNERRVSEAARQLQASLGGVRDAAIRSNSYRGLRFLPDPILSPINPTQSGPPNVLAMNRFIPIEPAPDHSEGLITIGTSTDLLALHDYSPPPPNPPTLTPFTNLIDGSTVHVQMLTLTEMIYTDSSPQNVSYQSGTLLGVPTSWYWNIRQGDRVRFGDSGQYYTIAGPMQIGPIPDPKLPPPANMYANTDRFLNNGLPNPHPPSVRAAKFGAEVLYVLNGIDDDGDGYIDEAFDGIDNDGDGIIDPMFNGLDDDQDGTVDNEMTPGEYEVEAFEGSQYTAIPNAQQYNPLNYVISRRPVVSPGARETTLPAGIVIDLTTWNAPMSSKNKVPILLPERSRLPVDPYTYTVDILIAPSGQVVQAGAGGGNGIYNAAVPQSTQPFYHFWLTEREGVQSPLWGVYGSVNVNGGASVADSSSSDAVNQIPIPNPNYGSGKAAQNYMLPLPKGTPGYTPMPTGPAGTSYPTNPVYLTGERRLVTIFVKTGQIVTNSIETFNVNDTNQPFYDAQAGVKESQ